MIADICGGTDARSGERKVNKGDRDSDMRGGDGEYWWAVVAAQRFTPTGGTALCHVTGELSLTHKLRLLPPGVCKISFAKLDDG
mmetsp:Transcript_41914/g.61593  ORF Transcript_41914/g.61593 Transcript_41914/m.61593 type:complete len:84 (-) Transcript_41914:183-434(-)